MDAMQGDDGVQVIGADWNAGVEEVQSWVEDDGPGWEVVFPAEDTCFTGAGGSVSSKIDFFIVNRTGKHLLIETQVHVEQKLTKGQAAVKYTPLRTHKVVTITFKIEGQLWLEKWARKKAVPTGRVCGPYRPYALIAGDSGRLKLGC